MKRALIILSQVTVTVIGSKCYSCMPRYGTEEQNLRYYYPVGNVSHIITSTAAQGNYFGFVKIEIRRQITPF